MKKGLGLALGTLAAGSLMLSANSAQAAFTAADCNLGGVTYNGAGFTSCTGGLSGNVNPAGATSYLNGGVFAGITDWVFDSKINTPGATEAGTPALGFDITPKTGATSGDWGFSNTAYTGPVVLELKAANFRSYYYFESITGASTLLGDWNTNGVAVGNPGQHPNLSHASLFYRTSGISRSVPEPATLLGLLAMTGLGVGLKRKQVVKA